jgi:hypothetical protein
MKNKSKVMRDAAVDETPEKQVIAALDRQQNALEGAQEVLGCLEERLSPILRNKESTEGKSPEPQFVPLANRIEDHNFMIVRLANAILDIRDRLEI